MSAPFATLWICMILPFRELQAMCLESGVKAPVQDCPPELGVTQDSAAVVAECMRIVPSQDMVAICWSLGLKENHIISY